MKAPDYVGHQYGPDSAELEATLAEQDRQVARVIQALEKKVGANQFLVVITADHGMPSEPQAPRKRYFDKDFIELVNKKFDPERNAVVANFDAANTQVFINKARLRELGLSLSQIKEFLEAQPFIFAAYTEDEIERAASLP
jgi:predicted AlkP superfamily pyrophosphatase or phosphodiesterase